MDDLTHDAPRDTLGYQIKIRDFVYLFNLFFRAVPWVPKSVNNFKKKAKIDVKRSYFAKYSCFGGIFVTNDYW